MIRKDLKMIEKYNLAIAFGLVDIFGILVGFYQFFTSIVSYNSYLRGIIFRFETE